MGKALFFSRFYYILFFILALSIPFTPILYFFVTPLLLILWLIEGEWKVKWNQMKESGTLILAGALSLFWLINLIGLFYSTDLIKGFMRTYDKLPFLVYSLVFFTLQKNFYTEIKLHTLLKGFICATAIMLLICWSLAFVQFFKTGSTTFFYYTNFSHYFGHPSYCALIVSVAFCVLYFDYRNTTKSYQWLYAGAMLFFAVSIYFLQSRSGILAFFFLLIFLLFYDLRRLRKRFWHTCCGLIFIVIFSATIIYFFPSRVGSLVDKMKTEHVETTTLLGARSEIWGIGYHLAMKNIVWGIGTGYPNGDYLSEKEQTIINPNQSFINTHNQFLQTFLEHGILGLGVLVFMMVYSFYYAIKTKNYLLLMLVLGFFIHIFFESMFERGHGIITFCFFYGLLIKISAQRHGGP